MPAAPGAVPAGWDCHVHVFDAQAPVATGHYRPPPAALDTIESLAAASGIGHLVLVQPSVYGTDNSVMLRALEAGGGRHRGIAVIDPGASDAELDRQRDRQLLAPRGLAPQQLHRTPRAAQRVGQPGRDQRRDEHHADGPAPPDRPGLRTPRRRRC